MRWCERHIGARTRSLPDQSHRQLRSPADDLRPRRRRRFDHFDPRLQPQRCEVIGRDPDVVVSRRFGGVDHLLRGTHRRSLVITAAGSDTSRSFSIRVARLIADSSDRPRLLMIAETLRLWRGRKLSANSNAAPRDSPEDRRKFPQPFPHRDLLPPRRFRKTPELRQPLAACDMHVPCRKRPSLCAGQRPSSGGSS